MAIDTRAKRQSVIGVCLPVPSLLPEADSDVDEYDRRALVWLYQALADIATLVTPVCRTWAVASESRAWAVAEEDRTWTIGC